MTNTIDPNTIDQDQIDAMRAAEHQVTLSNQDIIQMAYAHAELIGPLIAAHTKLSFEQANCFFALYYQIRNLLELLPAEYLAFHRRVVEFYKDDLSNDFDRLARPEPDQVNHETHSTEAKAITAYWQLAAEAAAKRIAEEAERLADTFMRDRTGIRDGDGTWHGSDVSHHLVNQAIPTLRGQLECELKNLETAKERLQECYQILSPKQCGPAEQQIPF